MRRTSGSSSITHSQEADSSQETPLVSDAAVRSDSQHTDGDSAAEDAQGTHHRAELQDLLASHQQMRVQASTLGAELQETRAEAEALRASLADATSRLTPSPMSASAPFSASHAHFAAAPAVSTSAAISPDSVNNGSPPPSIAKNLENDLRAIISHLESELRSKEEAVATLEAARVADAHAARSETDRLHNLLIESRADAMLELNNFQDENDALKLRCAALEITLDQLHSDLMEKNREKTPCDIKGGEDVKILTANTAEESDTTGHHTATTESGSASPSSSSSISQSSQKMRAAHDDVDNVSDVAGADHQFWTLVDGNEESDATHPTTIAAVRQNGGDDGGKEDIIVSDNSMNDDEDAAVRKKLLKSKMVAVFSATTTSKKKPTSTMNKGFSLCVNESMAWLGSKAMGVVGVVALVAIMAMSAGKIRSGQRSKKTTTHLLGQRL